MIVKFQVVRKDTKAPIQGAKIVLEHGETDGITNSAGEAEIVTYWSGNLMYSITATGYDKVGGTTGGATYPGTTILRELGAYVAPPVPPPPGESIVTTVGLSCDVLEKSMYGRSWFRFRNRYTADGSPWSGSLSDAIRSAEGNPSCYQPPPPPPKSVDDVQKDVDILRGTLQGISSRVQDLVTSITEMGKALVDLETKIKAWVIDSILDLIWSALTRENKVG